MRKRVARIFGLSIVIILAISAVAQTRNYPDKIRGYKVERTVVEVKKVTPDKPISGQTRPRTVSDVNSQTDGTTNDAESVDQLITFGQPEVARMTPLGITFEVPIVVAPVKQSGKVDFLVFEDMTINGRSVEITDYHRPFDLPNKHPLSLREPLRIYIYLPGALLAALGEWTDSQESWPVTGRVYVFGKFKKSILGISTSFKRCVPVELNLKMRNPLRER